jgi:hypothetical protein
MKLCSTSLEHSALVTGLQQVKNAGIALGLLMRTGHTKALLKKKDIKSEWKILMDASTAPLQNQSHSSTNKMLGKRDIDALTKRDAEPWLQKLGNKPHVTVNNSKQQLHTTFSREARRS